MRRFVFRVAVALGVAMVAGGAVVGYLGYEDSGGPSGAVRGYFAALADDDAPRALAWGDVPSGPRTLLTSEVLGVQQRIAPIRNLQIVGVDRAGSRAVVHVSYTLAFPGVDAPQRSAMAVVEHDGDWRLTATAVPIQILLDGATHRAHILGAAVPQNETLAFPGAVPVTFDSPYLGLEDTQATIEFDGSPVVDVPVVVTSAGQTAARQAVAAALAHCFTPTASLACPLPSDRFVPGSVDGTVDPDGVDGLSVNLAPGDDGVLDIDGGVPLHASYRRLTFANRVQHGDGPITVQVHARAYATTPLTIDWSAS